MKPNDKAIDAGFEASAISVNGSVFGRVSRSTMKEILEAAYAAQFQSEDYAGLVKELRAECRDWLTADCVEKSADAIEALLAERDDFAEQLALRSESGMAKDMQEIMRINNELVAERDALAASLAPVDDDILREIAAMHFAKIDGHSDNWDRYVDEAKDYIDAIRPHIEAVERERCAKELTEACELLHRLTAIIPGNDGAGEEVAKFLRDAAIRRST